MTENKLNETIDYKSEIIRLLSIISTLTGINYEVLEKNYKVIYYHNSRFLLHKKQKEALLLINKDIEVLKDLILGGN